MKLRTSRRKGVAILMAMATCVSACGDSSSGSRELAGTLEHLQARDAASRHVFYRSIDELLPNVRFLLPSGEKTEVVTAVVVGTVTKVHEGRAYDEEGRQREVEFNDPSADWRTMHMDVDIEESLGQPVGDQITVGIAVGGAADPSMIRDGLGSLGRVLLFMQRDSAVFAYDPNLYSILEDGSLLATVDDSDIIRLPVKGSEETKAFLGGIQSLRDLRTAATGPQRDIRLSGSDGFVTRD